MHVCAKNLAAVLSDTPEPESKHGELEGSKGQSQPEIAAAAVLILYMVLGRPVL